MSRIAEAFDGTTYDKKRDMDRLRVQLDHVRGHMMRSGWQTLEEIATAIERGTGQKTPTASVSARLRDMRKPKFGSYTVSKRIRKGHKGLWEYHLDLPSSAAGAQATG